MAVFILLHVATKCTVHFSILFVLELTGALLRTSTSIFDSDSECVKNITDDTGPEL